MNARILLLAALISAAAACQDKPATQSTAPAAADSVTAVQPLPDKQCYSYFSATDTVTVIVKGADSALTGSMVVMLNGKDRNIGTLAGKMIGDTLVADYTFQSEGVSSVREVAFLKKDGKLVQGYGPVEVKGDRQFFTDRSKLSFDAKMPLSNQNCH